MQLTVARGLLAAAVALTGVMFARGQPVQAIFQDADVPYVLRANQGAGALRMGCQEGRVRTTSVEKKLLITWTSSAIANQQPAWTAQWSQQDNALDGNRAQGGAQEFSTRYFPTASCVLGPDALLIAGITPGGSTVIERWNLAWPSPMPVPMVNPQTGVTSVSVALPSRTSSKRLYDADVVGRRYVRSLCALRRQSGAPTECLVQFYDSNDLCSLDLASGQVTLLASAVSASGVLGLVPGLQPKNHSYIAFGDRISVGYKYTLGRGMKFLPVPGNPNAPPVVVLVDTNRDGTIDAVLQMTELEYAQQGWANLSNYENWWLY